MDYRRISGTEPSITKYVIDFTVHIREEGGIALC